MRTTPALAGRAVTLLTLASLAITSSLAAQGTIRGVVHDSLRLGGGVEGAQVVLLGADRRTTTDARGRFEFSDVADGTVTVAWWSPWLDSLALPPVQVGVQVRAGTVADVRIATPSLATYQRAVCGTTLDPTDGILLGELRDPDGAALAGVAVGARWHETRLGVGRAERLQRAALDTANATGFFALCGVPTDAEFVLVAGSDAVASGEVITALQDAPVRRRDLVAGPWAATARVRGRVIGPDSQPLAGAVVAISGDSARVARTDASGRFVLDGVPRRTNQFIARAIGFTPVLVGRDVLEEEVELDDVQLPTVPQELAAVTINGAPMTAAQAQFETRRARGLGFFVDDATLARIPVVSSTVLSSLMPRTGVQQSRQGPMLMIRRGAGFCRPRFYVDGYDNGNLSAEEEGSLMARAKRVEVYTANAAPPQFNDFDGCGAVVIWTR
jgi:Carboxypeptidase regulatory-like domain